MVKRRPVIVVSRHETHARRLCTVIPLSTTSPTPKRNWHHPLPHLKVTGWQANAPTWAKCDMLVTVSFERLNKPYTKTRSGRNYVTLKLDQTDIAAVLTCLRAYFGIWHRPKSWVARSQRVAALRIGARRQSRASPDAGPRPGGACGVTERHEALSVTISTSPPWALVRLTWVTGAARACLYAFGWD